MADGLVSGGVVVPATELQRSLARDAKLNAGGCVSVSVSGWGKTVDRAGTGIYIICIHDKLYLYIGCTARKKGYGITTAKEDKMTPQITKRDDRRGYAPQRQITFGTIILWTLALALALVVLTNLQTDSVDAAGPQATYEPRPATVDGASGLVSEPFCEPRGFPGHHTMADVWSAEMEHAIGSGSGAISSADETEMETVWSAEMTVGTAAESRNPILVYTGYFPLNSGTAGALDDTGFSHDGLDYNIRAIFEQEFSGTVHQLIFEADHPLHDNLVLQVDDDQFLVSESRVLGSGRNIHSWMLEESLGWEEGALMPIALMELPAPDPSPGPICNTIALK